MDAEKAASTAHVLRKTFDHVDDVSQRPHVDAYTPQQRVGIFKTSYRRESVGHDVADLTSRHLWSDIGVPRGETMSGDLQAILAYAAKLQPDDEAILVENRKLRDEAKKDVRQMELIVADLEKLNAAEEVVLNRMLAIS
jgi:hypothetical protein